MNDRTKAALRCACLFTNLLDGFRSVSKGIENFVLDCCADDQRRRISETKLHQTFGRDLFFLLLLHGSATKRESVFIGLADALARIRSVGERRSSPVTEPEEKPLRTVSFVAHATRGLIRDRNTRRKAMFVLIVLALLLLFGGSTFLQAPLNPREHPLGFLLFWIICGWLAFTAVLLAIFDVLIVKLESRREQRALRESLKTNSRGSTRLRQGSGAAEHSPGSTSDE